MISWLMQKLPALVAGSNIMANTVKAKSISPDPFTTDK